MKRPVQVQALAPWFVAVVLITSSCQSHAFSAKSNPYPVDSRYKSTLVNSPQWKIIPVTTTTTISTRLWRQPNKWDFLDDDEDDEDEKFVGGRRQYTSCPPDMMYEPRIVQRAHQTFLAIRQAGGKETTNDVYVRDPIEKEVFWYTGKVARVSDVSLEECIHRLYPMIERHACHLRPLELYPHRGGGTLEVWAAPGDSELEVAYNRPSVQFQKIVHSPDWQYQKKGSKYPSHIKASMVGFQGEVYQEGEDGFRTWRNDDGLPARPEINPGGETRPPTPQELEQIQKELSGASMNTPKSSSSSTDDKNDNTNVGYIDADFTSNKN